MTPMGRVAAVWRPVVTEVIRDRIDEGVPTWLPVHGRSMWPLLEDGTRILVVPSTRIRFGDLLAYACEGAIVCHRVIWRQGVALMTRADHGGAGAERVRPDQIVGVVAALERRGAVVDLTRPGRRAQAVARATRSLAACVWATARRLPWRRV
jgi:hypothetical protein